MTSERCAICLRAGSGGTLTLTSEVRSGSGHWNAVSTIDAHPLCGVDYSRLVSFADGMAGADEHSSLVLGLPMRASSRNLGPNHCDCCQSELGDHAATLELVPTSQSYRRGSRTHREGELRRLRVCRQCLNWWRATMTNPSSAIGAAWREVEGATGGWINPGHGNALAYQLRHRDAGILAATMTADGMRMRTMTMRQGIAEGEVAFVGAGKRDRASSFVRSHSPAERGRIVVVCQPDQLSDTSEALRLGASEFLASPLSPQQIVGAFARVNRDADVRRDAGTGLRILGAPVAQFEMSCMALGVTARNSADVLELALMARRFLRGYDEVGSDGRGGLSLHVYALHPESLNRIVTRLSMLLGKGVDVIPFARALAATA